MTRPCPRVLVRPPFEPRIALSRTRRFRSGGPFGAFRAMTVRRPEKAVCVEKAGAPGAASLFLRLPLLFAHAATFFSIHHFYVARFKFSCHYHFAID